MATSSPSSNNWSTRSSTIPAATCRYRSVASDPSTPSSAAPSSAQVEMERRLGDPGQLFRSAFENAPIAMALTGLDGSFLAVNRSFCEFIGRDSTSCSGMRFQEITHPDDWSNTVADARRIIADEKIDHEIEKRYLHADGSIVWGLLHTSLVRDADGDTASLHLARRQHHRAQGRRVRADRVDRAPAQPRAARPDDRPAKPGRLPRRARGRASSGSGATAARSVWRSSISTASPGSTPSMAAPRATGSCATLASCSSASRGARTSRARLGADTFGLILPEVDAARAHYAAERIASEATGSRRRSASACPSGSPPFPTTATRPRNC